jgi:predicted DNA-binding transcriptional regulator AlpA
MSDDRPPAYPSKATLAHELDCAESTVDELVRKGILPKPIRLTGGCVRWVWTDVELALNSLKAKAESADPYLSGVAKLGEDEDGKKAKGRS